MESNDFQSIVSKLQDNIDKLTEVSANISKLLAVQEQKLSTVEKDTERNQDDIRHIYARISEVAKELSEKIDESMENSTSGHAKIQESLDKKLESYDSRIKALEMWRWLVIGGAMVIGWIINKLFK